MCDHGVLRRELLLDVDATHVPVHGEQESDVLPRERGEPSLDLSRCTSPITAPVAMSSAANSVVVVP
jgi:hypothetical protein